VLWLNARPVGAGLEGEERSSLEQGGFGGNLALVDNWVRCWRELED
jgi:hypothetical protein